MKYSCFNNSIGLEYMHLPIIKESKNAISTGMYYANGTAEIKETCIKQKGGSKKQYNDLNKSPNYYLDLSKTVGGRPVIIRKDNETHVPFLQSDNKKRDTDYQCYQPYWLPNCR